LKLDELTKLREVDIIQLSVEGNPPLARLVGTSYRGRVLAGSTWSLSFQPNFLLVFHTILIPPALPAVPSIWVLDGHFALSSECVTPPPADTSLPRVEASSFDWRRGTWGGEDDEEGRGRVEGLWAARHLAAIRDQPSRSNPQRDPWRLSHLASTYDHDASTFNGFVRRGVGRRLPLWPLMHLRAVELLGQSERLDLLTLLCADISYSPPRRVVSEAFTVLLAQQLGAAVVSDLCRLPPFGKTVLAFVLRQALIAEVTSVPEGPNALPRDKQDLLHATPAIVAKGTLTQEHAQAILSRHAVALLARAPSCPALSIAPSSSLPPLSQKMLNELNPLLGATGVAKAELTSSSFSTSSVTDVGGSSSVIEANYESFFLSEASAPLDADLSHVRRPRPGERLKWSASGLDSFAYIVAVSETGSSARVAFKKRSESRSSLLEVIEEVARSDMYWDPQIKGWVHVAAAAEAQRLFRAARRPLSRGKKRIGDDFTTSAAAEVSPSRDIERNASYLSPSNLLPMDRGKKSVNRKLDHPLPLALQTSRGDRILNHARAILIQQGREPSSLLEAAPHSRPLAADQEAGSEEWAALQRDMGSFRECNQDRLGLTTRPPLLDARAATEESSVRKRSVAEKDGKCV